MSPFSLSSNKSWKHAHISTVKSTVVLVLKTQTCSKTAILRKDLHRMPIWLHTILFPTINSR